LAVLTVLGATLLAGCGGGAARVGSPSATPPRPSAKSVATARPPSSHSLGSDWPTYHAVNARTGAVKDGPPLRRVRHLWTVPVDGAVYAEPLVVHGRVIIATENDSVYALDAATGSRLWGVHLASPVSGGSLPCGNIDPSGITSTPVADPRRKVIYVVIYRSDFMHVLVALDAATGAVRWQRLINPPGEDPKTEQQRAALSLFRGRVYIPYGGLFGDCGQYHGWVLAAPESGPGGPLVTYRVPTKREGAIWATPGASLDAAGDLYVATGNGSSASFDFGNAVIRLSPGLRPLSYFAPPNSGELSTTDTDLGSTGPLPLPGSRVFIIGKSGVGYLLDAGDLGGIGNGLARINLAPAFGGDAYANGTIYVPTTAGITAVRVAGDSLKQRWTQSAATQSPILAGPGLWAIGGDTLYQLDPASGAVRFSASIGESAHFATPAASGGRIFVAADGRVQAFG
jgi:outer membrane protein assembly factor BamB